MLRPLNAQNAVITQNGVTANQIAERPLVSQRNKDRFCKIIASLLATACYENVVWSTLSNTKLSQLQQLLTRAKKLIANAKLRTDGLANGSL